MLTVMLLVVLASGAALLVLLQAEPTDESSRPASLRGAGDDAARAPDDDPPDPATDAPGGPSLATASTSTGASAWDRALDELDDLDASVDVGVAAVEVAADDPDPQPDEPDDADVEPVPAAVVEPKPAPAPVGPAPIDDHERRFVRSTTLVARAGIAPQPRLAARPRNVPVDYTAVEGTWEELRLPWWRRLLSLVAVVALVTFLGVITAAVLGAVVAATAEIFTTTIE